MIEVRLLGPLDVVVDGRSVPIPSRAERLVLVSLAMRVGRPVTIETLADEVWGDDAPASWRKNIHVRVSRLRHRLDAAMGPVGRDLIETRDAGYALALPPASVDAVRLEQLLGEGRRLLSEDPEAAERVLGAALDFWRGPPLPELGDSLAGQAEVARLTELGQVAIDLWHDAAIALGRHEAVVGRLEAALVHDPLRERWWGQLMVALYQSGRQADALRAYQRARDVLGEQLGLEPGPELRRLEAAILAQELPRHAGGGSAGVSSPASTDQHDGGGFTPPPGKWPGTPLAWARRQAQVPLVGRDEEMGRLVAAWRAVCEGRHGGAVVMSGSAGVGKTRLAAELALVAAEDDGLVLFGRCLPGGGAGAIAAALAPLGLAPPPGPMDLDSPEVLDFVLSVPPALLVATEDRPCLLVLDDAHWADPLLLSLLRLSVDIPLPLPPELRRPLMAVLVRRDGVSLPHDLAGLESDLTRFPVHVRLAVPSLDDDDAAAMFEEHLGWADRSDADRDRVRALARSIGGNPQNLLEMARHISQAPIVPDTIESVGLPEALAEGVARRIAEQPVIVSRVLTALAVAGGRAEVAQIARGVGEEVDAALAGLEQAAVAGLVEEGGIDDPGFAFVSDVTRLALLRRLSPVRRDQLRSRLDATAPIAPGP